MKIILAVLFAISLSFGQDSTLIKCDSVVVVDSVLFKGRKYTNEIGHDVGLYVFEEHTWAYHDSVRYSTPDEFFTKYNGNYRAWLAGTDTVKYRICIICLRWERYHMEERGEYWYDPYFEAVRKFGELK